MPSKTPLWLKIICTISLISVIVTICLAFDADSLMNLFDMASKSLSSVDTDSISNLLDMPSDLINVSSNISWQGNTSISSPLYKIVKHKHNDNTYALFCFNGYKPIGIGNALAIYWTARAIAFFMNYSFIMNDHLNNETKYIDTRCRYRKELILFDIYNLPSKWTWFIPWEYHHTLFTTTYPQFPNLDINEKKVIASQYNPKWQERAGSYQSYAVPYAGSLIFVSYNAFFIPVIKNDTREAFKKYYSSINSPLYEDTKNQVNKYNVIAIHLRLGDTLLVRSARRILLKFEYFKQAFDLIYQKLDKNKDCKISVIAQLDMNNVHVTKDKQALSLSNRMAYFIVDQFKKYLDKTWSDKFKFEINLIGNDTVYNDYFRMVTAPFVIGSPSSLCLEAVMANFLDTKLIIMPSKGPWEKMDKNFFKITKSTAQYRVDYHHWIDVDHLRIQSAKFGNVTNNANWEKFKKWFMSK